MQGDFWIIRSKHSEREQEQALSFLMEAIKLGLADGDVHIQMKTGDKAYTPAQHSAIWKYCGMVAEALSSRGVTLQTLLESMKKGAEIEVTKENVKYQMWAPLQKALFAEKSMRYLEKQQVSQIYDHINRFLVNEHSVSVPFPSKDLIDERN